MGKQYSVYKEENVSFRVLFLQDPQSRILAVEKCDFPWAAAWRSPKGCWRLPWGAGAGGREGGAGGAGEA
jgi:hypothetical protein